MMMIMMIQYSRPPSFQAPKTGVDDPVRVRGGHSGDRPEGAAGARGQALHCGVVSHA